MSLRSKGCPRPGNDWLLGRKGVFVLDSTIAGRLMNTSHTLLPLGLLALGALHPQDEATEQWDQAELEAVTAQIQKQIEALRGDAFRSPVHVELTDAAGLVEYAKKRLEVTETEASLHADELAMKHLGLLPLDMDYLATTFAMLEEQVGGFYDPASDSFYLMDRFSGGLAKIILAHELTHALDDQLFDIDGTLERTASTTDAELAYHAVVEGSGLGTMYAWMTAHKDEWTLQDLIGAQGLTGGLDDAPAVVWQPMLGSYWLGVAFLTKTSKWRSAQMTMKAPKVENVKSAFAKPPLSTEQILHPEKYWEPSERDDPRAIELTVGALPEGWTASAQDTLGEIFLALACTPSKVREAVDPTDPAAMMRIKFTNDAATGWGGDRIVLLEKDGASLLELVTVWDSEQDAVEFETAMKAIAAELSKERAQLEAGGGFAVVRSGDSVRVTSSLGLSEQQAESLRAAISVQVKSPTSPKDDSSPR